MIVKLHFGALQETNSLTSKLKCKGFVCFPPKTAFWETPCQLSSLAFKLDIQQLVLFYIQRRASKTAKIAINRKARHSVWKTLLFFKCSCSIQQVLLFNITLDRLSLWSLYNQSDKHRKRNEYTVFFDTYFKLQTCLISDTSCVFISLPPPYFGQNLKRWQIAKYSVLFPENKCFRMLTILFMNLFHKVLWRGELHIHVYLKL